jgi:ATP-dependent protease HslVU (ClpYQ) peptidase subunit
MTVALAYADPKTSQCFMLSDSCASDAINHSVVKNLKVFNPVGRRDVLIGCAGTFRLPNLLKYVPSIFPAEDELATEDIDMSYLVNEFSPVIRALTDDFEDDDLWEMLIAVNGKIYRMQMDMSIIEPADDCEAIGCGGSVALGAFKVLNELEPNMPIEDRMKHALRVECDTVQGCAQPFQFVKTEVVPDDIRAKIPKDRDKTVCYEIVRTGSDDETDDASKDMKKNSEKKKKRKGFIL